MLRISKALLICLFLSPIGTVYAQGASSLEEELKVCIGESSNTYEECINEHFKSCIDDNSFNYCFSLSPLPKSSRKELSNKHIDEINAMLKNSETLKLRGGLWTPSLADRFLEHQRTNGSLSYLQ